MMVLKILKVLGFEVHSINSVEFSNHTGTTYFKVIT
jgi:pyridoxal/pyridoxine/pyridoxamine kinase